MSIFKSIVGTRGKRVRQSEFIERVKLVHGTSLGTDKAIYRGAKTYVTLTCNSCGVDFEAYPDNVIRLGTGCPRCSKKSDASGKVRLYLVKSKYHPYIKVGVTSKTIAKRFGTYIDSLDILLEVNFKGRRKALQLESEILDRYRTEVTGVPYSSEWVSEKNLADILKLIHERRYSG